MCPEEAALAIKSYSPDLCILPLLNAINCSPLRHQEKTDEHETPILKSILKKSTGVVIGPGLSREPALLQSAKHVLTYLIENHPSTPVIIDAVTLFSRHLTFPFLLFSAHELGWARIDMWFTC